MISTAARRAASTLSQIPMFPSSIDTASRRRALPDDISAQGMERDPWKRNECPSTIREFL